jgi:hypothetical protein
MFEIHPSELKNMALAASAAAERDGFIGTAAGWAQIARMCADDADFILSEGPGSFVLAMVNGTLKTVAG